MRDTNYQMLSAVVMHLIVAGVLVPLCLILLAICLPFAVIWTSPYILSGGAGHGWYIKSVNWVDVIFTKAFKVLAL